MCFTTAKVQDAHAYFICSWLVVIMRYNILSGIGLRIVDTSVPSVAEVPADTRRLAVIIIVRQGLKIYM